MKTISMLSQLALAALLVTGLTQFASAQTNRGSITGTVLDPTGAVVLGVKITARNAETGITAEAEATDEGSYRLQQLPAGIYTLTATAQGFKTAEITGIVVEVNNTTSRDIGLETGAVSETVTVSSEGALTIQSDTSDVGTVVKPRQVLELPLAAGSTGNFGIRSPEAFAFLTPGVLGPGTATDNGQNNDGSQNGGTFQSKFAGSQNFSNEVLLEGASTFRTENGSSFDETAPSIEAFQEFKVFASTLPAEYGRTGGGVTSFAFRSGTNDFNGSAYDFFRNRALNANRFFRNALGRDASGREVAPRPFSNFNNFGGTIGGPIFLPRFGEGGPRLYNGRDRSFFFFIYENSRQNFSGSSPVTLPTVAFRNGDFSSIVNANRLVGTDSLGRNVFFGQIFDPATTRAVTAGQIDPVSGLRATTTGFVRDQFPGNRIDPTRISRVAQNVLGFIPTPNLPGLINGTLPSQNFLLGGAASPLNVQTYAFKLDHQITQNSRLSGSYSFRENDRVVDVRNLPDVINRGNQDQVFTTRYLRVVHDQTFSPNVLNHFNLGYNRTDSDNGSPVRGQNLASQLGIRGVAGTTFPEINFGGTVSDIGFGISARNIDNGLRVNDFVSVVTGNHSFRIGGDFRYQQYTPLNQNNTSGTFNFGNGQTGALLGSSTVGNSGFGFASFLLGNVANANINITPNVVQFRQQYYAAFVQDDWKVRQNLTLNLGLRYEIDVPRRELSNRYTSFDPTLPNPGAGGRLGALAFAGRTGGFGDATRFAETYYKNFGPRVGFAYSPDRADGFLGTLLGGAGKTVFRGGFGIYYQALQYADFGEQASDGFNSTTSFDPGQIGLQGFNPAFNLDAGLPAIQANRIPPFIDPTFNNLQDVDFISREHGRPGMITNYSFEVQRELANDLILNVGYIGSQGHHLRSNLKRFNNIEPRFLVLGNLLETNINDVTAADRTRSAQLVPGLQLASPFAGFSGNVADSLRPYPQYRSIITDRQLENAGNSTFNAGYVKIERRFSQGFNLLASYTFSKTLTDADSALPIFGTFSGGGEVQNPYDLKQEKAVSNQDIPHSVVLSYIYELPFGEGRRFDSGSRIVDKLVGGFQVGAVHRYQSGQPLSFGGGRGIPTYGRLRYSIRPGVTTDDILSEAVRNGTFDPRASGAQGEYFNEVAFFDQNRECPQNADGTFNRTALFGCRLPTEPFRFGNLARTLSDVRSQAFFNEDINILKRTPVSEDLTVEFRTEFINVFNRTIFRRPNTFDIASPEFGRVYGQSNNPRIIQFAIKLLF
ncbi:MAG: TonB-dependent receptor [Acidobacteriota bacterium]|nr:TonB-dependent receptor [Acidobacteriota bacterium]